MIQHTDETVRELVRSLRAAAAEVAVGRMSPMDFDHLQTEKGWNDVPDTVLFDELIDVQPVSVVHLDWFHTYLQTGIFSYEFGTGAQFLKEATHPSQTRSHASVCRPIRVAQEISIASLHASEGALLKGAIAL